MGEIRLSYILVRDEFVSSFIDEKEFDKLQEKVADAHTALHGKTGLGNDSLGWIHLPSSFSKSELEQIKRSAETIQQTSDVFIVIGVGGSYLGAKAAIEQLSHSFYNELSTEKRNHPQILFIGKNFSSNHMHDLLDLIEGKDISINVISKSGTTLETAVAFHFLKEFMEEKYGKAEASKRIYVTTDEKHGDLKKIATENDYPTFHIPRDIGGRYSVLTAVGLLPMAVANINVDDVLQGALLAETETSSFDIKKNHSYYYALLRHLLYKSGKKIELFVSYEPQFKYLQEWWKQLFGESEGKEGKGVFPASAIYSTDLHSIGQYIQEGERHLFQTVLFIENNSVDLEIKPHSNSGEFIQRFANVTMNDLNKAAFEGALVAHREGNVPSIVVTLPKNDAFTFGYLVYFFEKACALSGYLLGVNPFDQPGVEAYKKNMHVMLHKNKLST